MTIQQPRWALLAVLVLVAAAPRAAHAQNAQPGSGWTTPVYHPPPANPPPAPPSPAPSVEPSVQPADAPPSAPQPAPPQPGYAPGYGPPPGYAPGYRPPAYVPPAPPPGPTHAGFFLRLHIGPGYSWYSSSGGTLGTTTFSGSGLSLGLALGGAVAPNLALYGTFFETVATDGHLSTSRTDLATAVSAGLGGLGAGAIYYFEPANVYISGTLAFTVVLLQDSKGTTLADTQGGVGFQGMVGKEWWVSEHWGLGAAGEVIAAGSMKEQKNTSVSWSGQAVNIVFSATYF